MFESQDIDRCRWCSHCRTLFVYSSAIEGMSDDDFPFEPCPECGVNDAVEIQGVEPGSVKVISGLILKPKGQAN